MVVTRLRETKAGRAAPAKAAAKAVRGARVAVRSLSHSYRRSDGLVLDNMDFEINQGEVVALLGRSGCGKSTLLHMLAGLTHPSEGEVVINGNTVNGPSSRWVMMFQAPSLYPWMTVAQNAALGLRFARRTHEIASRVPEVLDLVDIREGYGLEGLSPVQGGHLAAMLCDGSRIEVDFVITGIGVRPASRLAEAAGLEIDDGIKVDAFGRTSRAAVFAAGDCASFPLKGQRIRLESVPNAIDQAEATAATMLSQDAPYVARPWFWSDQYDVKLQIAGLNSGYDRLVTRPGGKPGSQSHWYFRGAALLAVDAMNEPRAHMTGKRLIEAGQSPDPGALADPAVPLKSLPLAATRAA